jgi:tetratricopeptide (TPR) repeat protein
LGPEDVSPPTARAVLDRSAETIAQELADRPLEQAALLERIGRVYVGMGLQARGRAVLESAVAVRERAGAGHSPEAALTLCNLAWACHMQNNDTEALGYQDRAIRILEGTGQTEVLAVALSSAADFLISLRRFDEAETRVGQAIEAWSSCRNQGMERAGALEHLGALRARRGDPAGAREAFLEATRARGAAPATDSTLPFALAQVERVLKNTTRAEELEQEAVAAWAQVPDPLSPNAAGTAVAIAGILNSQGRPSAAEPFLRRAHDGVGASLGEQSATAADTRLRLATALHDQGKLVEAAVEYRSALEAFRRLAGDEHPDVGTCLFRLAQDRGRAVRSRDAAGFAVRGGAALPRLGGAPGNTPAPLRDGPAPGVRLAGAGGCRGGRGAPARVRAGAGGDAGAGHRLTAYAQTVLGGCLVVLGRAAEAEAMLPEAVSRVRAGYGPGSLMTAEAESRLASLHAASSR